MDKRAAEHLTDQIKEIQALLEDRATHHKNDEEKAVNRYADLYLDVDIALEKYGYQHINPHRDLDSIWRYSKQNSLDTYAERRDHIQNLYGDILFDLRRKIAQVRDPKYWTNANETIKDELTPIRTQWLKAKNFIYTQPPDFENSIKESINSIESVLKILLKEPTATLGHIIKKADIDPDIQRLISQAYGSVSNKDFVRHGGTEEQNLTTEDAKFFLNFAAISILYLKEKLKSEKA